MAKAQPLELTQEQRNHLEAILRTRTIQAQIMNRARIPTNVLPNEVLI